VPGQSFRGFSEKVALVTNGASGLGRAVALQLALEGAYVIVQYAPTEVDAEQVVAELKSLGTLALSTADDVSEWSGVERAFAFIQDSYGRLDLLVNVAGSLRDFPLEELTEEVWEEQVGKALRSAVLCSRAAAQLMSLRPSPAIVNVAGAYGTSLRSSIASGVTASAFAGLTRALAIELKSRIRVNCVVVGAAPESVAESSEIFPKPANDDVARACIYLMSPDSKAITGQTLYVGI
jgi:3-oxoacyl-[acyl-carrier protein] reductase